MQPHDILFAFGISENISENMESQTNSDGETPCFGVPSPKHFLQSVVKSHSFLVRLQFAIHVEHGCHSATVLRVSPPFGLHPCDFIVEGGYSLLSLGSNLRRDVQLLL